jgi:transcriptional regulator with XRE-family HTH domain
MSLLLDLIQAPAYASAMDESFGARLKRFRERAGYGQKELGSVANRSESWVSNLESGKIQRQPAYTVIVRWAAMLGVSAAHLATGVADSDPVAPVESLPTVLRKIGAFPVDDDVAVQLDQVVAAGPHGAGIAQGDDSPRRRRRSSGRYLVRISGRCLEPRASDGDFVEFDPNQLPVINDLVVVAHGDEALVKYLAERDGIQWLLPLDGDPIKLVAGMRIVGVVREIRRRPGPAPRLPR